tara:strand:+ start:82 stop:531 length:450 start_codon:yes stop_codon:yes gene_type:complete
LQEKLLPILIGSPLITFQLKVEPPDEFKDVGTPKHIVTSEPAYVLEITLNPITKEADPFTGQASSSTVTFIAVKGFVPGNTTKQKEAVTGEVVSICKKVDPGNNWVILEVTVRISFVSESVNTISKHILSPSQASIPKFPDPGNIVAGP